MPIRSDVPNPMLRLNVTQNTENNPVQVANVDQATNLEPTTATSVGLRVDAYETSVDKTVEVMFTPHQDAYGYELQCIDEVIAARKADPAVYSDEDNPHRILYMVFNLRNARIVDKLFEAIDAGVKVQVLVEADQIADDRPWNKLDEWFEERGLKVLRSDKNVDEATRAGAHLVGIDKRSLMHMKSRIFRSKDASSGQLHNKVLTGSLNPGGDPIVNEENLNVIRDARVVDMFEKRYYEVLEHRQARNVWDDTKPVNVLFTPYDQHGPRPTDKLFEWIDQEQEMILISVFALHDLRAPGQAQSLVDKLKAAQERGVKVMAITDRRKSDGVDENGERIEMYGRPAHDDPTDEMMAAAGIPIFELVNDSNPFGAVHGKSVICGLSDMKVMTGAGNWTVAAMGSETKNPTNEESFVFVESGKLDGNATGRAYLANFMHLLRKYDDQYEQAASDVVKELQQHPQWPQVGLDLSGVRQAFAGQEVYLVADSPEIKAQTPEGAPGMPIDTSPSSSSPPFRPADPVHLPFGSMLDLRLAVRDAETDQLTLMPGSQIVLVE